MCFESLHFFAFLVTFEAQQRRDWQTGELSGAFCVAGMLVGDGMVWWVWVRWWVNYVLWSYLVRIGRDLLSPTYNALATVNFDKSIITLVTIIEVHVIFQLYIENNQREVLFTLSKANFIAPQWRVRG